MEPAGDSRHANLRIRFRPLPDNLANPLRHERTRSGALSDLQRRVAKSPVGSEPEHAQPLKPDPGEILEAFGERRDRQGERSAKGLPDDLGAAGSKAQPLGPR